MPDAAFYLMANKTAQVLRYPAMVGGKRGEAELFYPRLACTPIDPITEQTGIRLGLPAPYTQRECYIESAGVIKGDVLVVDNSRYNIAVVESREWPTDQSTYLHLVLEAFER